MKMSVLTVKDMKAQLFLRPTCSPSIADARRSFEIIANDGDSMVARFPHDFRLFHIAEFDPQTGELAVLQRPEDLGSAADYKQKPVEPVLPFDQNGVNC